jgi:hypothetical protein
VEGEQAQQSLQSVIIISNHHSDDGKIFDSLVIYNGCFALVEIMDDAVTLLFHPSSPFESSFCLWVNIRLYKQLKI